MAAYKAALNSESKFDLVSPQYAQLVSSLLLGIQSWRPSSSAPPLAAALKAEALQAVVSQNLRVVGKDAFDAFAQQPAGNYVSRSVVSKEILVTQKNFNTPVVQRTAHGDSC